MTPRNSLYLNILRFFSAQCVLFGHLFSFYQFTVFKDQTVFPFIQRTGLVILLIISGYLTAYSLSNKASNSSYQFIDYAKERFLRIFTPYIPTLLFVVIVDTIVNNLSQGSYSYSNSLNVFTFFANMFMLQNSRFTGIEPIGSGRPLWTLPTEWWAYIVFGLFFFFIIKKISHKTMRSLFTIRNLFVFLIAILFFIFYFNSILPCWIAGVIIYYLITVIPYRKIFDCLSIASAILAAIIGLVIKDSYSYIYVGFIVLSIGFTLLAGKGYTKPVNSKLELFFKEVAKSSYSLYLTHYTAIVAFMTLVPTASANWITILSLGVACNLLAIGFYLLFEKKTARIPQLLYKLLQNKSST